MDSIELSARYEDEVLWRKVFGSLDSVNLNVELNLCESKVKRRVRVCFGQSSLPFLKLYLVDCDDADKYWNKVYKELSKLPAGRFDFLVLCAYSLSNSKSAARTLANFFQPKKSVKESLKTDFRFSSSRLVILKDVDLTKEDTLKEDVMKENMTKTESLNVMKKDTLKSALKTCIEEYFSERFMELERDARNILDKKGVLGWNYCTYYVSRIKSCDHLETFKLREGMLKILSELETVFYEAITDQTVTWFTSLISNEKSLESDIFEPRDECVELIKYNNISLCDICIYLFSKKASLLLQEKNPKQIFKEGLRLIGNIVKILGSAGDGVMSWVYNTCMSILTKCEELSKQGMEYEKFKGRLLILAREILDTFGSVKIYTQTPHKPRFEVKEAPRGKLLADLNEDTFYSTYEDISLKAVACFSAANFHRTSFSLKTDLAVMYYSKKEQEKLAKILPSIISKKNMLLSSGIIMEILTKSFLSMENFLFAYECTHPHFGKCKLSERLSEELECESCQIENLNLFSAKVDSFLNSLGKLASLSILINSNFCTKLNVNSIEVVVSLMGPKKEEGSFYAQDVTILPKENKISLQGLPLFTKGVYKPVSLKFVIGNLKLLFSNMKMPIFETHFSIKNSVPPIAVSLYATSEHIVAEIPWRSAHVKQVSIVALSAQERKEAEWVPCREITQEENMSPNNNVIGNKTLTGNNNVPGNKTFVISSDAIKVPKNTLDLNFECLIGLPKFKYEKVYKFTHKVVPDRDCLHLELETISAFSGTMVKCVMKNTSQFSLLLHEITLVNIDKLSQGDRQEYSQDQKDRQVIQENSTIFPKETFNKIFILKDATNVIRNIDITAKYSFVCTKELRVLQETFRNAFSHLMPEYGGLIYAYAKEILKGTDEVSLLAFRSFDTRDSAFLNSAMEFEEEPVREYIKENLSNLSRILEAAYPEAEKATYPKAQNHSPSRAVNRIELTSSKSILCEAFEELIVAKLLCTKSDWKVLQPFDIYVHLTRTKSLNSTRAKYTIKYDKSEWILSGCIKGALHLSEGVLQATSPVITAAPLKSGALCLPFLEVVSRSEVVVLSNNQGAFVCM